MRGFRGGAPDAGRGLLIDDSPVSQLCNANRRYYGERTLLTYYYVQVAFPPPPIIWSTLILDRCYSSSHYIPLYKSISDNGGGCWHERRTRRTCARCHRPPLARSLALS